MKKRNQIPNFKTQIDPGYKKQASKAKFITWHENARNDTREMLEQIQETHFHCSDELQPWPT
jgi:hypothetical protein